MTVHRILLSGGTGKRVGAAVPKQFLQLAGVPVLCHSARTLRDWSLPGEFVVVAPEEHIDQTRQCLQSIECRITSGGETRHESTLAGIAMIRNEIANGDLILIHDAARPLITRIELDRLYQAMQNAEYAASSLVGPVSETIVRVQSGEPPLFDRIVPRGELRAVKTPQIFRAKFLDQMLGARGEFTDLLSWIGAAGLDAILVPCESSNIKLTSPEDLPLLETFARARKNL